MSHISYICIIYIYITYASCNGDAELTKLRSCLFSKRLHFAFLQLFWRVNQWTVYWESHLLQTAKEGTSPGGNLPQNLWTYPTAWHTAYPTTPRTYAMCKSPWHTGRHGQVFGLVCYFPKGFGTFCISSWILWPHPKCQGTHGTPTNCFLSTQVLRCNSHCRNNIFNL